MKIESINIITKFKHFEIAYSKPLFNENGVQVSSTKERTSVLCGDFEGAKKAGKEVEKLAQLYWTEELINSYEKTFNNATKLVNI